MSEPEWAQRLRAICEGKSVIEPGVRLHKDFIIGMLDSLHDAKRVIAKETQPGNRSKRVKRWYSRYKKGPKVGRNN